MGLRNLTDLDWARLLAALAARCVGEAGKRRAQQLALATDPRDAAVALAEVKEAKESLDHGEPLPLYGLRDVSQALDRLRINAVLTPGELRDVGAILVSARMLRRFLAARSTPLPALTRACSTDPTLDEVEGEITQAFEPDGTLSDHASPRLRELRGEYRSARARMISRLEELARRYAPILQDSFWTEREGRYVLPVRTDAHERFPGIVLTTSGSGATLFVEPRALIPLGNRLKVLEGEVRREEEAIYAHLSGQLYERLTSLIGAVEALTHADVRAASARLAVELRLAFVDVTEEPVVDLRAARHPLLVLDGVAVVPCDLRVRGGEAVIVSGPNAGGKTVALKTVGLCALLVRAGLPLPCANDSKIGFFHTVCTDIGDGQSLQQNLSTFSAHVQNLAEILDEASAGALVLLDEIATGTDPREGEALAAAVLDGLCARGAAVVCTTHYEALKTLALADTRYLNASVGFDLATMQPTFQLFLGLPGGSSALAVAKRFGIPSLVLERAQTFLSREHRDFETLVARLQQEHVALQTARVGVEAARREAEENARRLEDERTRVHARERGALDREIVQLRDEVRQARDALRQAREALRSGPVDAQVVRDASRAVDQVAAHIAIGGAFDQPAAVNQSPADPSGVAAADLRRGTRVYVPRLRVEAEVIDVLGNGQLRVAAGPLKVTVHRDELRAVAPRAEAAKADLRARGKGRTPVYAAAPAPAMATSDTRCDVRGLRTDDALRMAEQFVDRLVGAGERFGFVIHGHGTGALREAIRAMLRESRYVQSIRPAEAGEGGDGVTVLEIAA